MALSVDKILAADRRSLGQAITLLESSREDHRSQAEELLNQLMPHTGGALRIGITGVPGVGKSTFIDAFGMYLIEQGKKVAVLTVDPSSTVTGGSILGDKTRMESLSQHSSAFIRPSPSGATLGGVARRTRESILVCEAAGYDVVIVETVGVGQSETLVSEMTDVFLLLLMPGSGDDLQGIKRGIMELADLVVVNKSDGELKDAAGRAVADVSHALRLLKPRMANWQVPTVAVSSTKGNGIDEVWRCLQQYTDAAGGVEGIETLRKNQSIDWLWREVAALLLEDLRESDAVAPMVQDLQHQIKDGKIAPSVAARQLLKHTKNLIR